MKKIVQNNNNNRPNYWILKLIFIISIWWYWNFDNIVLDDRNNNNKPLVMSVSFGYIGKKHITKMVYYVVPVTCYTVTIQDEKINHYQFFKKDNLL